jgi:hypothetical protein
MSLCADAREIDNFLKLVGSGLFLNVPDAGLLVKVAKTVWRMPRVCVIDRPGQFDFGLRRGIHWFGTTFPGPVLCLKVCIHRRGNNGDACGCINDLVGVRPNGSKMRESCVCSVRFVVE